MGLSTGKPFDARDRDGPHRRDDQTKARRQWWRAGWGDCPRLILAALALALLPSLGLAETLRIATWNSDLSRKGPGLLANALSRGKDPQITAAIATLVALDADVIVLTSVDYDRGLIALTLLADQLEQAGVPYPHRFALRPNTGLQTGLDLDGDGRMGEADDAQGWGQFSGQSGMAILSRLPIDEGGVQDYSTFLWADLPGSLIPPDTAPEVAALQRLSTTGHWQVPLTTPDGGQLTLLAYHATPPVFDGPEDRNGRRNHDESAFWALLLNGETAFPAPKPPFIILGDANLDPADGDGLPGGITSLLTHPLLQDPAPKGSHRRSEPAQKGDPALDTALYDFGGLRVDYVIPSADLTVIATGVLWPPETDPLSETLATASRHAPVWVDITLP